MARAMALEQDGEGPALPRAIGTVRLSARLRDGATRISALRHSGSAKALFPRGAGPQLDAVLLNTSGGITGGDRFRYEAVAEPGAHLTLTTQAAERGYRARARETGTQTTCLAAGEGARIEWLPQETILFDGSALRRSLEISAAEDAAVIAAEPVILGRPAMGERLARLSFTDDWRIRRGGQLVYADATRLDGTAPIGSVSGLAGAGAFASIVYLSPDAARFLDPVRALLHARAGASLVRPGILAVRILAACGRSLRATLSPILALLRGGPLPKVWMV